MLAPDEARRRLTALLDQCEPFGAHSGSRAILWSLSGMRHLIDEAPESLRLADCLILAGVLAHLIEDAMRAARVVNAVPRGLADAHRDLFAFMECCAFAAAASPPPETSEPRADRALRYLREHYARSDLTITDVARHVGLSRPYLARLLVECTGRGFLAHLHERRLDEARRLLVVTLLSVKEVAAAVGYSNAAQFCRQFKRFCRTSPGAYRRAARSANRSTRTQAL
jgi:AraC-like DNA-binding protein